MANANYVRNSTLLDMLKAAEQSQSDRLRASRQLKNPLPTCPARPSPLSQPSTPAKAPGHSLLQEEEGSMTPVKTQAPINESDNSRSEIVPLTADEVEWLDAAVERNGHGLISQTISRLVDWANSEPPEAKKKLFLVIRCRRCSAGAKGGVKSDHSIKLTLKQWQWLENVQERCRHASVGKTLRIIVDFYMPLCKDDIAFEQKVLRAGFCTKTGRHENAVGSVDPARALAIKGPLPGNVVQSATDVA